jgi:ankyrin repeat protein
LLLGAVPYNVLGKVYSSKYWVGSLDTDKYLKMALKYGANLNAFNLYGDDMPIFRSLRCDKKNFETLIVSEANVDFQNDYRDTPLMLAAICGGCEFVETLFSQAADHCIENSSDYDIYRHLDKKLDN